MDKKNQTIHTYNESAISLAKKFDELGARISDIEETFALIQKGNPFVLEIGCGNGRDAVEITKRTNNYLGIDISEKLIELAKQKVPNANFQVADIETFTFPGDLDMVFAFASLIHVPKEALARILIEAGMALSENGVIRLSMKYADTYSETTKEDEFGIRTYYLYSKGDIEEVASGFKIIKSELNDLRGQMWLEIILQKI
jgi:SAM-dependent methyltransferase